LLKPPEPILATLLCVVAFISKKDALAEIKGPDRWRYSRKILGTRGLIERILNTNPDEIEEENLKMFDTSILALREITVEMMYRMSKTAGQLYRWLISMREYRMIRDKEISKDFTFTKFAELQNVQKELMKDIKWCSNMNGLADKT